MWNRILMNMNDRTLMKDHTLVKHRTRMKHRTRVKDRTLQERTLVLSVRNF